MRVLAMTAQAFPKLALRPLLPEDVPLLAEIFRASIEELTAEDYSEAQQQAWAGAADDEEEFGARLAEELTLVATLRARRSALPRSPTTRRIDMLYVHPIAAGQGAGAMLCDALGTTGGRARRRAKSRSMPATPRTVSLKSAATSRKTRNTVSLGDEWLANTTMVKRFAAPAKGSLS